MKKIRCKIKEYIQPFEKSLAIKELISITSGKPIAHTSDSEYHVETNTPLKTLVESLAYWEVVSTDCSSFFTTQSKREATVNVVRNGIDLDTLRTKLPFKNDEIPLPNRRCLRYGPHGIHEYRGKFFPQLVRSLINISGTPKGGIVVDPMSGSGTTIVEANLIGCRGFGIDMNPLSVFIGNTKCELLNADPSKLKAAYVNVREELLKPERRKQSTLPYFSSLSIKDQDYLRDWFGEDVLSSLDDVTQIVQKVKYQPAKNLMLVALSNILRSVSWQKEDDLRVRKEVRLDIEIDPKKEFLEELGRSIRALLAFLYQNRGLNRAEYTIENGDARNCTTIWKTLKGKVDVVITSPPYATALPYLDTDRLSLCYLGLLAREEYRKRDVSMIGNREVTENLRVQYLLALQENRALLPKSVHVLIKKIENGNSGTDAGFRRKNLPALLAKYFLDMREVLSGIYAILKPGAMTYMVVGSNHTIAGGQRVDIMTPELLSDIAQMLNFKILQPIPMEMLVSRDIFKKNASTSEKILVFQKPINHI